MLGCDVRLATRVPALHRVYADKTPDERGQLLEQTKIFADIHAEAAKVLASHIGRFFAY